MALFGQVGFTTCDKEIPKAGSQKDAKTHPQRSQHGPHMGSTSHLKLTSVSTFAKIGSKRVPRGLGKRTKSSMRVLRCDLGPPDAR